MRRELQITGPLAARGLRPSRNPANARFASGRDVRRHAAKEVVLGVLYL